MVPVMPEQVRAILFAAVEAKLKARGYSQTGSGMAGSGSVCIQYRNLDGKTVTVRVSDEDYRSMLSRAAERIVRDAVQD